MNERGFALIAVLLVLAMLGALGAEFAYSMRLEAASVRSYKDTIVATHLAEAAVEQAIREIVAADANGLVTLAEDGDLTFYKADRTALPRLPRTKVPLGAGAFSYRLSDEEARINLNRAQRPRVEALLVALGLDKSVRDTIEDSLEDWRDADEDHRLNGAESEDTYLKLSVPYRSKNGNLDSVDELLQVHGVTRAIFEGTDGRPGLADFVTVRSSGLQVNVNTASPTVLRALGLLDAKISDVLQARKEGPLAAGDLARLGVTTVGGVGVHTGTFRIMADGLVDGHVRAQISAIVRRPQGVGNTAAILEWSGAH